MLGGGRGREGGRGGGGGRRGRDGGGRVVYHVVGSVVVDCLLLMEGRMGVCVG